MEEESKEMGGGRRGKDSRKVWGGYPTCIGVEKWRGKGEGEGSMEGKKIGKGRKEDF